MAFCTNRGSEKTNPNKANFIHQKYWETVGYGRKCLNSERERIFFRFPVTFYFAVRLIQYDDKSAYNVTCIRLQAKSRGQNVSIDWKKRIYYYAI
ncbi:MAG TPA: hypothetical protein DIU00_03160 [Phycisphaerales bacterium]|nr:hypothetical protein [Phycisphaerales bacterium]